MSILYEPSFWWLVGFECLAFSLVLFLFPIGEPTSDRRTVARAAAPRVTQHDYTDTVPVGHEAPEWIVLLVTFMCMLALLTTFKGGTSNGPTNRNGTDYDYYYK